MLNESHYHFTATFPVPKNSLSPQGVMKDAALTQLLDDTKNHFLSQFHTGDHAFFNTRLRLASNRLDILNPFMPKSTILTVGLWVSNIEKHSFELHFFVFDEKAGEPCAQAVYRMVCYYPDDDVLAPVPREFMDRLRKAER